MGQILSHISSSEDQTMLQLAGPILHRIFLTEESAFLPENFRTILSSKDDLNEFPNLIEVNDALSSLENSGIDELDCHFNVICCDLINEIAFKDLEIKELSSSDVPVLNNFHKAMEIMTGIDEDSKNSVFVFVCAVAFLRAFMTTLARFLAEHENVLSNGKHDLLLSDIFNCLQEDTTSPRKTRKTSLSGFFIKELHQSLCWFDVLQLIENCERLHPLKALGWHESEWTRKLSYDPFEILATRSTAEIALGKHVAGSDSQPLKDVLDCAMDSSGNAMELTAVIVEKFYLVRSVRKLKVHGGHNSAVPN